jgi:flagellar motor switch protein FliM
LLARRPRSGRLTRTDSAHLSPRETVGARPIDEAALANLRTLQASLTEPLSQLLTNRLGTKVRVRPTDAILLPAGQFLDELAGPQVIHPLRARPLRDPWLLAIPLPFAHVLLDRLLGGSGEDAVTASPAPLTELDARLLASITEPLLEQFAIAWRPWLDLEITIDGTLIDPHAAPIGHAREIMARIVLDIEWSDKRPGTVGRLQLAVPASSLESLRSRRKTPAPRSGMRLDGDSTAHADQAGASFGSTRKLPVRVYLEQCRIRLADASQLAVGDVIATEQGCDTPLTVYVDGRPRYLGLPAAFQGKKVVQIETVLDEQPDMTSEMPSADSPSRTV